MEHSLKLLVNYLQDILEQPDTAVLRPEALSPDFRELGGKITLLAETVHDLASQLQQKNEALELENQVLMDNIQAMDEISWALEQSNQELRSNLALVNALTDYTHNMIFVYAADTCQEVHANQPARWFQKAHTQTALLLTRLLLEKQPEIQHRLDHSQKNQKAEAAHSPEEVRPIEDTYSTEEIHPIEEAHSTEETYSLEFHGQPAKDEDAPRQSRNSLRWEMTLGDSDDTDIFYQVESFLIPWLGSDTENPHNARKQAIVHIVIDETERQRRQKMIYRFAYVDPLTNLKNRRYAMEKMEQWLQEGTAFTFSFIDVDYLKYCNDTFGHEAGDSYLIEISRALQTLGGEVCRVGGDEFFVLQTQLAPAEQDRKLEELRRQMLADKSSGHPKCFSYATILVPAHSSTPLTTYISDTDTKMYQYKQKYKIPLSDVVYRDDRI
ncbi:MAG: GGDEF domain-containing protein [Lachnospiraceae bacterium]|nr:GGDEF domain-containing protein [Lachnospiraceae bacterium]